MRKSAYIVEIRLETILRGHIWVLAIWQLLVPQVGSRGFYFAYTIGSIRLSTKTFRWVAVEMTMSVISIE